MLDDCGDNESDRLDTAMAPSRVAFISGENVGFERRTGASHGNVSE
jgi:hypothetical protein